MILLMILLTVFVFFIVGVVAGFAIMGALNELDEKQIFKK